MECRVCAVLAFLLALPHAVRGQFWLVTPGVPGRSGTSTAVAADVRVVAGYNFGDRHPGWTWTLEGGRIEFGNEPGMPAVTDAFGISADGSAVVGAMNNVNAPRRAYRYRGPGTMQDLGTIPRYANSVARAANADGSVVVGNVDDLSGVVGQAFRWTESGGMQRLGFTRPGHIYSDAVAVSRDGSIIAGNSRYVDNEAFVWDAEIGMTTLPPLPGTPVGYTYAFGMNANGTVVVGQSGIGSRAAYWRNGEVFDLGKYDWARSARAVGASDDGSVIVGYNSGVPGTVATVWTPTGGMQRLHDYLAAQGVVVPAGWSLYNCTGVSADGLTFVGSAVTATATAAYVVTIPTPGSMLLLGLGLTTMRFRRLVHK